jgi:RNA polymerase sigma factor (sigma-70 family)
MNEKSDAQLLRDYAELGSEAAFRELVQRHTDFIYSAALRQVNSPDLACDLAQSVFTDLARKAEQLSEKSTANSSLAGWLHRSTRYAALNHLRDSRRRLANERQAMEQLLTDSESSADWEQIRPALDEALDSLSDEDREALLLRYFKNQDFRAVGLALGVSDDAAQKRVSRAVERLREFFSKRGVTAGAGGLAVLISANAIQSAPVGLAVQIVAALPAASAAAGTGTTLTLVKIMALTKIQFSVTAIVITGAAIGLIVQHHNQLVLREQTESLREQLAQLQSENESLSNRVTRARNMLKLSLPGPRMRTSTPSGLSAYWQTTNLIARLQRGEKAPTLTTVQAEKYLDENHRSAGSLLAAFRATGDQKLLKEAMEKYPDDPQVAFTAAYAPDASPEERRHWLDVFKQSAPENSLANYLSALDHFKAGRTDQAIQDLSAAAGKQKYQDYSWDFVQNGEEAYRSAGYPEAQARIIPNMALVLPQLAELKQLNEQMINLAAAYRQAGDESSAQAALQMDAALGQRLDGPGNTALITQLVGMAIETIALKQMDPNAPYGNNGQTVQGRLDEVNQRRTTLTDFAKQLDGIYASISPADWISYHDRWQAFGEDNAVRWLLDKYGQK